MSQQLQYAPPTAALLTLDVATATVCPTYSSSPHSRCRNSYSMPHLQQLSSQQMSQQLQYAPPIAALLAVDVATATVCPTYSSSPHSRCRNGYSMPHLQQLSSQ